VEDHVVQDRRKDHAGESDRDTRAQKRGLPGRGVLPRRGSAHARRQSECSSALSEIRELPFGVLA